LILEEYPDLRYGYHRTGGWAGENGTVTVLGTDVDERDTPCTIVNTFTS
jgi:hypothetical protein